MTLFIEKNIQKQALFWLSLLTTGAVCVTISVMADYDEGEGYSVGGRRIAVGEKLALRFTDFAGEGYCINLSTAE